MPDQGSAPGSPSRAAPGSPPASDAESASFPRGSLWRRRSTLVFFLVAFGVPWTCWTAMRVFGIPDTMREPSTLGWILFFTGDFVSVAGFVAAWADGGREGLKELLRRCLRVRVHVGWWAFALLVPFLWSVGPHLAWAATHGGIGGVRPGGVAAMLAPGAILILFLGPLGEEAGWRGFLLPRLVERHGPLMASAIVGTVWSVWHLPIYLDTIYSGAASIAGFTFATICFSIIMTVLMIRARWSVPLAVLFHWSQNTSGGVVRAVLPDIERAGGLLSPPGLIALGLCTLAIVAVFAPGWSRRGGGGVTPAPAEGAVALEGRA